MAAIDRVLADVLAVLKEHREGVELARRLVANGSGSRITIALVALDEALAGAVEHALNNTEVEQ